jgi:hypothetical protein
MRRHCSHKLNSATRVAKGNGQSELARAKPTTSFSFVAKPSPTTPSGAANHLYI